MQNFAVENQLNLTDTFRNFHKQKMVDKKNSIRRRKYLLKFPQLVLVTHLKPETSWNVMSLIKATATQAVFLFSHYTFSLFLLKLILPLLLLLLLLLLYTLILPFSHPFSKVSPSFLILFSSQRPLGSPHIFCRLPLSLDIVCTSHIRVYNSTTKLLPVLLIKKIS